MRVLASSRSAAPGVRPDGIEVANPNPNPNPHPHPNPNPNPNPSEVVPLEDLLSLSDFVSVHCPLNDQTRGLIGAEVRIRGWVGVS